MGITEYMSNFAENWGIYLWNIYGNFTGPVLTSRQWRLMNQMLCVSVT